MFINHDHWTSIADNFGFSLKEGVPAILESAPIRRFLRSLYGEKELDQLETLAQNSLFSSLFAKIRLIVLIGEIDGLTTVLFPADISTSAISNKKKSIPLPRLLIFFPQPLQNNLKIQKINLGTKIKRLFQTEPFSNPTSQDLAKRISFSSDNLPQLKLWLNEPTIASLLLEQFSIKKDLVIEDFGLRVQFSHAEPSITEIQNQIGQLTPIARKLSSLTRL